MDGFFLGCGKNWLTVEGKKNKHLKSYLIPKMKTDSRPEGRLWPECSTSAFANKVLLEETTPIHLLVTMTIAPISHNSKVTLKILQARLQQYVNRELPDVQAGFRKDRGTRDQIAIFRWMHRKSKRVPEKHLFLLYWLCQSLWLCGSQ